ncbi:vesicle-associated membrane protein 4 isoform X1 [Gasterosteus aculeatus]
MTRSQDPFAASGGTCWRTTLMKRRTSSCEDPAGPDLDLGTTSSSTTRQVIGQMRSQVASTGNHPTFEPLTYDAVPRVRRVQSQVDEVIDVMQENISKVIERGERLDDLQDKSESLSDNASAFSSRAKQLHRRMWWRDTKMKMIVALVVVALLLIIIIPVILRYR